jgi:hypothetical protein
LPNYRAVRHLAIWTVDRGCRACLRVPRRERCRALDDRSWDDRLLGIADDQMTARFPRRRRGARDRDARRIEGRVIIVVLAATDEDLNPT